MGQRYFAGPCYKGNPGDTRREGDEIPEAACWKNIAVWVSRGSIVVREDVAEVPPCANEDKKASPVVSVSEAVSSEQLTTPPHESCVDVTGGDGNDTAGTVALQTTEYISHTAPEPKPELAPKPAEPAKKPRRKKYTRRKTSR